MATSMDTDEVGQSSKVSSAHEDVVVSWSVSPTSNGEAAGSDDMAVDEGRQLPDKSIDTSNALASQFPTSPSPECELVGSNTLAVDGEGLFPSQSMGMHDVAVVLPAPEHGALASNDLAAEQSDETDDETPKPEEIEDAIAEVLAEDAAQESLWEPCVPLAEEYIVTPHGEEVAGAEPPPPDPRTEDDDDLPARPLLAAQPVPGLSAGQLASAQEEWQGPAEHERSQTPSRALVLGMACRPGPGRPHQLGQLGLTLAGVSSIDEDSAAPADEGFASVDAGIATQLPLPLPCVPRPSPLGAPGGALTAPSSPPSTASPSSGTPHVPASRRGNFHTVGHAPGVRRRLRGGSGPRVGGTGLNAGSLGLEDVVDDFLADDPPVCPDENSPLVERIRPLQYVQPTPALGVPVRFRRHGSAPPPGVDARSRADGGGWCGSVALERRCNYSPLGFPLPPPSSIEALREHGAGTRAAEGSGAASSSRDTNLNLSPLHLAQLEDGDGDGGWCGSVATERSDGPRPPLTGPRTLLGGGGGSSLVVTASGGVEPSAPDSARGLRLQSVQHQLRVAMQSLVACDVQLCAHLVDRGRRDGDVRARREVAALQGRLAEARADAARLRRDLQRLKGSRQELSSMPTGALHALQQELSVALQSVNEELEARTKCCVCRDVERQVVLQPCRHLALCAGCARRVTRCPLCRRDIDRFEAVSVA